jgi:hypothetical protein
MSVGNVFGLTTKVTKSTDDSLDLDNPRDRNLR